jgi:adenine deaminase
VLGLEGIDFMLENAEQVPFYFFFGAPSCVPATPFETAGAEISVEDIKELFKDSRIKYLSEMMNWPGVLFDDPVVLEKIQAAVDAGRPVDGHAPGLRGDDAVAYINHGISTDHETYALDEAYDKLGAGMTIMIREGSASRNYDELHPIIGTHPDQVMFCTDDAHPDGLAKGEIDYHVRKSLQLSYDMCDVLKIASKNPVDHYDLPVGLLREGDSADFIVVDNLFDLNVLETWIKGSLVAADGKPLFEGVEVTPINNFDASPIDVSDIARDYSGPVRVIVAFDGLIITDEEVLSTTDPDVLKIVVVNRYFDAPPAVAFVRGFGLQKGALASSVAHDSHNIVAVGVSDQDIVDAVNRIIDEKGGLAVSADSESHVLPLPIAGLMSNADAAQVVKQYTDLAFIAKQEYGSPLRAPFMTLSFMALLVIPELKLSDLGLFDGSTFQFTDVAV